MASYKQYTKLLAWLVALGVVLEAAWAVPVQPLLPPVRPRVKIQMRNELEGREDLVVHCKDKNTDFGVSPPLAAGDTYEIEISPNGFRDYFCGFTFNGVLHWYDIYLDSRDFFCARIGLCSWTIFEAGPCLADRHCDTWNPQFRP